MLKQATVEDISSQRITRLHGRIVVVTHYYPRYLKRKLIHDYFKVLAPVKALLEEFKAAEEVCGDHDQGFEAVSYEQKFTLGPEGQAVLAELCQDASVRDVYLVCHCKLGQRCHRELLIVMAELRYGARHSKLSFPWEIFRKRLNAGI